MAVWVVAVRVVAVWAVPVFSLQHIIKIFLLVGRFCGKELVDSTLRPRVSGKPGLGKQSLDSLLGDASFLPLR